MGCAGWVGVRLVLMTFRVGAWGRAGIMGEIFMEVFWGGRCACMGSYASPRTIFTHGIFRTCVSGQPMPSGKLNLNGG